ncbi:MAG: phosphoribosylamine--glycine ligase [Clostridiales bacterium]|nr:phosphoribosylamine--glycine ligase [Clostridiales bacterium]
MKVLVVGSGGREHAIIKKLSKSHRITQLFCAPGNGGISEMAICTDIKVTDLEGMKKFAEHEKINLVFVASDNPLALGMVDMFQKCGIRAFGPNKAAAIIESSKAFSKELMKNYGIPTASYEIFTDIDKAIEYLESIKMPVAVKADGLALGKGAIMVHTLHEAKSAVRAMMKDKKFGTSGDTVIIEEYLVGREVTVLAFSDGKTVVPMVSSQDHKRAYDNDEGLNTGGMGAVAPSRIYTEDLADICMETIFKPTIAAMATEGRPFRGVIYFELMLTADGPKVIEYNARFGDPEAQVVLPLLKNDLMDVIDAILDGCLSDINIEWKDEAAACIVMASGGYPVTYSKGYEISGIDKANDMDDTFVYHAGTKKDGNKYLTNGGRVLGVTAIGENLDKALAKAYSAVDKIRFTDAHYRKDIGRI